MDPGVLYFMRDTLFQKFGAITGLLLLLATLPLAEVRTYQVYMVYMPFVFGNQLLIAFPGLNISISNKDYFVSIMMHFLNVLT